MQANSAPHQIQSAPVWARFCQWSRSCLCHRSWRCSASLWCTSTRRRTRWSSPHLYFPCQTWLKKRATRLGISYVKDTLFTHCVIIWSKNCGMKTVDRGCHTWLTPVSKDWSNPTILHSSPPCGSIKLLPTQRALSQDKLLAGGLLNDGFTDYDTVVKGGDGIRRIFSAIQKKYIFVFWVETVALLKLSK